MRKMCFLSFLFITIIANAQLNNLVEYNFVNKIGANAVYKEYLIFNENELFYANITNDDNLNYEDEKLNKERINFEPIYINFKTDSLYQSKYGIMKPNSSQVTTFILVEKKPVMNWKVTKESQKILGYSCYKATTKFRGREYIAWFTPDIPYNFGPWKLGGLPGLILKVENDYFDYEAKRVVLNSDKITPIISLRNEEFAKSKFNLKKSIEFENNWLSYNRSNRLASLPAGVKIIEKPLREDERELSFEE